eukprot:PITA_04200
MKDENWVKELDEEMNSIEKNNTWDLVKLLEDTYCIGVKWVYKTKLNEKGEIEKYKAGLIVRGFAQHPIVDYGNLLVDDFKSAMKKEFEINDLGLIRFLIGIEVTQSNFGVFVFQARYAMWHDDLKRFRMIDCKPTSNPITIGTKLNKTYIESNIDPTLFKRLVGSFMYLTATRPNIMYVLSLISRSLESPEDSHCNQAKDF